MSSKQRGSATQRPSKGQRLDSMARKRDERVSRAAHRKERQAQAYLADDENYGSFSNQLAKMGLQLRDIPGDGNCLFRALGDQLEGHSRNHLVHRMDVTDYIMQNKTDFEPFVEDDVPFDRHMLLLRQPGTYAGNDSIVAFARLHKVSVVIHQLNSPCWQVHGCDKPSTKQLHISYHNGDHYSSIRKIGDHSEGPASIKINLANGNVDQSKTGKQNGKCKSSPPWNGEYDYLDFEDEGNTSIGDDLCIHVPQVAGSDEGAAAVYRGETDIETEVIQLTGCQDSDLVRQSLEDHHYNVDATIDYLLNFMLLTNELSSASG